MKSIAAFIMLAVSTAIAQTPPVTYNSTTGVFTCPASNPNGAYCAGTSLETNIIIRCTNGIGQPGNCDDNLSGEPPYDLYYAPCWETSDTSGDAACSKNCIVYGASGNAGNGTFTIPGCVPILSTTSASSTSTSSPASSSTSTTNVTASTTSVASSSASSSASSGVTTSSTSITATVTTICTTGSTTYTTSYTTTYCPSSTLSTSIIAASSSKTSAPASSTPSSAILATGTGSPAPSSNGTVSTGGAGGASSAGSSATATPVGPTATTTPVLTTGGAVANSGSALAALGLLIAYFL